MGQLTRGQLGSCPAYLGYVMELAYLCRLRGIEAVTLTDANELENGVQTNRRKGSRDNVVQWPPGFGLLGMVPRHIETASGQARLTPFPPQRSVASSSWRPMADSCRNLVWILHGSGL